MKTIIEGVLPSDGHCQLSAGRPGGSLAACISSRLMPRAELGTAWLMTRLSRECWPEPQNALCFHAAARLWLSASCRCWAPVEREKQLRGSHTHAHTHNHTITLPFPTTSVATLHHTVYTDAKMPVWTEVKPQLSEHNPGVDKKGVISDGWGPHARLGTATVHTASSQHGPVWEGKRTPSIFSFAAPTQINWIR